MPTVPQSELPIPKSWDEFEDIVWDLYSRLWDDPNAQRYGRPGQAQQGVDVYGQPARLGGRYAGVQCKRYDEGALTRAIVVGEMAKAEEFSPPLAEYTIATTDRRNARLQRAVREISQKRQSEGKFSVHIAFWEDLSSLLAHPDNSDLLRKHYADWLGRLREVVGAEVAAYVSSSPPGPEALPEGVTRRLKVFLCHASGDKPAVRDLYHRLRSDGIAPWLDEEDLLPGQDWELEIPKAVRSSDVVIICLSSRAITKAGYVQKEIKDALDVADKQPEGAIFLIPLRLEECEVPERLRRWQWVNLFQERGYERLLRALRVRAESLGLGTLPSGSITSPGPDTHPSGSATSPAPGTHPLRPAADRWRNPRDGKEMVRVPAGKFLYGEDKKEVELPEFWIDKAPVTNAEYARFVAETGHEPPEHWKGKTPPKKIADHPVGNVSWHDAGAYATWAGGRLPMEEEWEKAARGTDGREYPWGQWAEGRCNSKEAGIGDTTPVGKYSTQGDSPYGCQDCAGNVWEWTASKWELGSDFGVQLGAGLELRVLRGGAFFDEVGRVQCAARNGFFQSYWVRHVGFRVMAAPASL